MGTTVTYNTVVLSNVVTRQWEEKVIYDSSGTDVIGHKFSLQFQGIMHAVVPTAPVNIVRQSMGEPAADTNVVVHEADVRRKLKEPRRELLVTVTTGDFESEEDDALEETTLLNVFPIEAGDRSHGNNHDVANGPKPRAVEIEQIIGGKVFNVMWSVDVTIMECSSESGTGLVLNNRWAVMEMMDENFFTERITRGRITLSSSHVSGHEFKNIIVPTLEDGFRRESVTFEVAENGLDCTYEVRDKQVHTSAPFPATTISGTHTESTNDGINMVSHCNVKLLGPPHVDTRILIARALDVIESRINFLSRFRPLDDKRSTVMIMNAALTHHFGGDQNSVEATITVKNIFGEGQSLGVFLAGVVGESIGSPIENLAVLPGQGTDLRGRTANYDPQISPVPAVWGYDPQGGVREPAVLFLLKCYLQDPCVGKHSIADDVSVSESSSQQVIATPGTQFRGHVVSEIPRDQLENLFSQSNRTAFYTYATYKTSYEVRMGRMGLPVAFSQSASGEEADNPGQEDPEEDPKEEKDEAVFVNDTTCWIDVAPPQSIRRISFETERTGQRPEIPQPLNRYGDFGQGGLNGTLLESEITPMAPTLSADGRTPVYRVKGYYLYGLNRPPSNDEQLRVGVLPFTRLDLQQTSITGNEVYNKELGP